MTYNGIRALLQYFILLAVLSSLLCGCGGGGGGASSSGSASRTGDSIEVAVTRSVRLNNYGVWGMGTSSDQPNVLQKRLETLAKYDYVVYGEPAEWVNDAKGWSKLTPQSLKALNPKVKVYRYYGLMWKNPNDSDWNNASDTRRMWIPLSRKQLDENDWWLRDGNGDVVKHVKGAGEAPWYVDVGKPGFKKAYLQALLDRNRGKGFDGFVLDLWHANIYVSWFANGYFSTNPGPPEYANDSEWFNKAWKPFIQYIADGLRKAGYEVIGNCAGEYGMSDPNLQWQRSALSGVVYEQFVFDWDGSFLPGERVEDRIYSVANDPMNVWVVDTGLEGSDPEYSRKSLYSLAAYYIAVPAVQDRRSYTSHEDPGTPSWSAFWDINIGTPLAQAVKQPGKYFWSRKFSNGLVLLNAEEGVDIDFILDRRYTDPSGNTVTGKIKVAPHTAMILKASDKQPE